MADLRIPAPSSTSGASPARPLPPARAEAVRAAQRAFFETALAGDTQAASAASAPVAAAPAAPVAAASASAPRPVAAVARAAFDPGAPAPTRPLRPGSLLDIKV